MHKALLVTIAACREGICLFMQQLPMYQAPAHNAINVALNGTLCFFEIGGVLILSVCKACYVNCVGMLY